jgi:hypothetical protein
VWCIVSIDSDEETARNSARRQLAFYLSTPSYKPVLEGSPWVSVADRVQAAFNEARPDVQWDRLEHLIPDDLLDELALTGTEASVEQRARGLESELAGFGVDELVFQTVGVETGADATVENCRAIVRALAPRARGMT